MASLMRSLLILVACWTVIGAGKKKDIPVNILDFMSLANGVWDNKAQIEQRIKDVPFFQEKFVPVKVPHLFQEPVVYVEIAKNDVIIAFELAKLTEDSEKTIILTMYNFTARPNKFGTYDLADLATINPEDLYHERGCVASYEFAAKGAYVGTWPDCRNIDNEVHLSFSTLFACDNHIEVPSMVGQPPVPIAVKYNRYGPRFPLINSPANYVNPCEKSY